MKKSLEYLGVNSSGLDDAIKKASLYKNLDDSISLNEVNKLNSLEEKEKYLKKILEKYPHGYVESKLLLADLVKLKDLKLSYNMILSAIFSDITSPKPFYSLAELAFSDNAFDVALGALDICSWLNSSDSSLIDQNINNLKLSCLDKKNISNLDTSRGEFWSTKLPEKYMILERVYYESNPERLIKYCRRLISYKEVTQKDFEDIFKVLGLLDVTEYFDEIDKFISASSLSSLEKVFLSGLNYFYAKKFLSASEVFTRILKENPLHAKSMLYLSLSCLYLGDENAFMKYSEFIIPESEDVFNAVYFISSALAGQKMLDMSKYPNDKKISKEIALLLERIHNKETLIKISKAFDELSYFSLLTYLPLYLSEMFVKLNMLKNAELLLDNVYDNEVNRIKSWIFRLKGDQDEAEEFLRKYRENYKQDENLSFHCKLINIDLPKSVSDDTSEILTHVKYSYSRVKEIISEIEMEYGINSMTCIETTCQDCCTKTYPIISFIEYLCMKEWLDLQSSAVKDSVIKNSTDVINDFKIRYGKDAQFIIGEGVDYKKYYPMDFIFNCPCLGDNKCNVYEPRPFMCRAYGYTSLDGYRFKGCNYFFEQFKDSTGLENYRKLVNMRSFTDFSLLVDKKFFGLKVSAFIPLWFSRSYEEVIIEIKKTISSYS